MLHVDRAPSAVRPLIELFQCHSPHTTPPPNLTPTQAVTSQRQKCSRSSQSDLVDFNQTQSSSRGCGRSLLYIRVRRQFMALVARQRSFAVLILDGAAVSSSSPTMLATWPVTSAFTAGTGVGCFRTSVRQTAASATAPATAAAATSAPPLMTWVRRCYVTSHFIRAGFLQRLRCMNTLHV